MSFSYFYLHEDKSPACAGVYLFYCGGKVPYQFFFLRSTFSLLMIILYAERDLSYIMLPVTFDEGSMSGNGARDNPFPLSKNISYPVC